ncbi:MAG TPA: hypothetical protein VLL48_02835 [Longimicrobiales bacterium]|nr:hypothetical protein [Longimicrobiales bacterium]
MTGFRTLVRPAALAALVGAAASAACGDSIIGGSAVRAHLRVSVTASGAPVPGADVSVEATFRGPCGGGGFTPRETGVTDGDGVVRFLLSDFGDGRGTGCARVWADPPQGSMLARAEDLVPMPFSSSEPYDTTVVALQLEPTSVLAATPRR